MCAPPVFATADPLPHVPGRLGFLLVQIPVYMVSLQSAEDKCDRWLARGMQVWVD